MRLFGIDAPALTPRYGPPATDALRRLVTDNRVNSWIWLEYELMRVGDFGRTLGRTCRGVKDE